MALFSPTFAGTVSIRTPGTEFMNRLRWRIDAGLLTGMPHRRSRYVVTRQTDRELTFRAGDFTTAINVGLNQVEVRIPEDSRLEYVVTYWRWAAYCIALCALIGTALIAGFLLTPAMRSELAAQDGAVAVFWGSVAFWGFVWPWLLIALHKPFARRCLNRVLAEIDSQAA
jgi:hypothetical protein